MSDKRPSCLKMSCGCAGVFFALGVLVVATGMLMGPELGETLGDLLEAAKGKVTETPLYTEALRIAEADPRVREKLGTPLEGAFPDSIIINRGHTRMEFVVTGPLGEGLLEAEGSETDDGVRYRSLDLRIDGERIDMILGPPKEP